MSEPLEADTYDLYARLLRGAENRLFVDFKFGTASTDWQKVDDPDNTAILPDDGNYHWLNLSELERKTMTAAAGSQIFQIAARYRYMRIDAFALGTATETFTDAELDAAVVPQSIPGTLIYVR